MGRGEAPARMLILDYALSTEAIVEGIGYPYARAGYAVDFRPFYPNLVRQDLSTYAIISLLAGRAPDFPSGRMSVEEVAAAVDFVRQGGTLILGPNLEGGEGAHERHQFNRLLEELGIAIRIRDVQIDDPVNGYSASMTKPPFYTPVAESLTAAGAAQRLAFDRSTPLSVGDDVEVALTTFESALPDGRMPAMAIGRAGAGYVMVAGRYLLNATGIPLRISGEPLLHPEWLAETEAFLVRLGRHLVDLAAGEVEWSPTSPCTADEEADPGDVDFEISQAPILDRAPANTRTITLPTPSGPLNTYDRELAAHYEALPDEGLYGWVRRDGIRASWGRTLEPDPLAFDRQAVLDVGRALESCGINLFWGISNCQAMAGHGYGDAERAAVAQRWQWTVEALEGTDVKWFPTLDYRYFRDEKTRCFGAQGQELEAPSPLDLAFWRQGWRDPLCAIAEYSVGCGCIGGIALDVELYAHPPAYNYYSGYGFEDLCFDFALDRFQGWVDEGLVREARGLGLMERYDWLRTRGLLAAYFGTLSTEVERLCRQVRDAVWAINADLLFASYIFTTPCNWFELGLYRGFSSPERPLILMTFNVQSGRMLEHLRRDRVYAYHASVALLGMIGRDEYEALFANSFRLGHGYWMNNINALLAGDRQSCESPGQQGILPEEAVRAIRAANDASRPGL